MYLMDDLKEILVTAEQIENRVTAMGEQISSDYQDTNEITIISIINGAILFTADLIRTIRHPLRMDSMRVSSYRDEMSPVTDPEIIDTVRLELRGRHVLLIDDILDTGRTISRVVNILENVSPASIRTCVLLEKKGRREVDFSADYVGFSIPDEFVVGYGLDFAEYYRNLPCIGSLKPEFQNPPVFM